MALNAIEPGVQVHLTFRSFVPNLVMRTVMPLSSVTVRSQCEKTTNKIQTHSNSS